MTWNNVTWNNDRDFHILEDESQLSNLSIPAVNLAAQLSNYTKYNLSLVTNNHRVQPFDETGKFLLYKALLGYEEETVKLIWKNQFGLAGYNLKTEISLRLTPHFKCLMNTHGQQVPKTLEFNNIRGHCINLNYIFSRHVTFTLKPKDPVLLSNFIANLPIVYPQSVFHHVENSDHYFIVVYY